MDLNPKELVKKLPGQRDTLVVPYLALKSVTSKTAGVYASSDTLFKGAVFGRDSLEVAEDLMIIKPRLVRTVLLVLARLQGQTHNNVNEEEPGKIIHEYRSVIVDGKRIGDTSMNIFKNLSSKWGGNDKEMIYYGSVDSTPHFLRTLGAYTKVHGQGILDTKIKLQNGETVPLRTIALSATQWVMKKLASSQSGLIEYKRLNPHGIPNQVWKDSEEFYVHENKESANHAAPIASIEVQGLAYDGLMAAADFIPNRSQEFRETALALRDRTIEFLWQEDRNNFAVGTDYDKNGKLRIIPTATANPAALLDTGFFDKLEPKIHQRYVTAIVENIMGSDFLTDAGIRSRGLSTSHLIDFWDYHGSYVSWPKETYDIAKGMRRQGLPQLARQLENRILNIFMKSREYPEFVYVDKQGRVLASSPSPHSHGELILVDGTNTPERIQAWTVSAVVAILSTRLTNKLKIKKPIKKEPWQEFLEKKTLIKIHKVNPYVNPFALSARYPNYPYRLADK